MPGGKTYRTRAIVLDKTKLRETDLIFTLLAQDGRQIRAVGKGARKPGSRLAARCELGCSVDLLLAHGRSLDVVAEADLVSAPLGPAPSFELLSAASAIAEVARVCSFEDAEDHFIFPLTEKAFAVLGGLCGELDGAHLDLLVAAYVFKLLSHEGYWPELSGCVSCGDEAVSYFSAAAGGALCASCASSVPGAEEVPAGIVSWLRALMARRFDELAADPIDAPCAVYILALAHVWAATHLDCRLRAFEFLLGR
ncbi:DNA repair protein RecO [Collinsella sp. An2]|uniref:DNA repair protein RecO n=1 Tax=Collinsella sp. An2 TaxID=1965585 RepID=UPI000B3ABC93|nr:DNA repair protein RecO [Collinsella sp. An2]OUP07820.1 DNA repair protein RecO [Collinsella sp. An2]